MKTTLNGNVNGVFIDIGAYSSKPSFVSENEELGRIVPVVQLILKHFPEALLSIDTFRSEGRKPVSKMERQS
jgi:dihydropteroate synthase